MYRPSARCGEDGSFVRYLSVAFFFRDFGMSGGFRP
jgi:hypothetical protein